LRLDPVILGIKALAMIDKNYQYSIINRY